MNTQLRRSNDSQLINFNNRKERLRINDAGYHYHTREGEFRGPFETRASAYFDLNVFIEVTAIEKELQFENYSLVA